MIEKISNHIELAKKNLMSQYKEGTLGARNSKNLRSLLEVFTKQIQELEDAFYDLYSLRYLEKAFGLQLDKIGKIVGIKRYELNDEDYRKRIYSQIILNCKNGETETLIIALKLIMNATDVEYNESYVGKIRLKFFSKKDGKNLQNQINRLCLAGIKNVELVQVFSLKPFKLAESSLADFQLKTNNKDNIIVDSENSGYNLMVTSGTKTKIESGLSLSDTFIAQDGQIIKFKGGILNESLTL
jgi:hypothetical protein